MLESLILLSALAGAPACAHGAVPPQKRTPVPKLAGSGAAHHRVLVIDQDFHPNDDYEIAIDGWVACGNELANVRMWWMDTGRQNERSPFGKGVYRFIDIDYRRANPHQWTIGLRNGRKDFSFDIQLDDRGNPHAYSEVELRSGVVVPHCRVEHGRLVARRILGIPAGLKDLEVTCIDATKRRHRGTIRSH